MGTHFGASAFQKFFRCLAVKRLPCYNRGQRCVVYAKEKKMQLVVEGKIRSLHFAGQPANLPVYDFEGFEVNDAKSAGLVHLSGETYLAYSKWSSPKRTRTYPFARIYDTYSYGGKIVTIIPVFKDEGAGERENDTNLDRVNYITYSWMNLSNIYIILAWYVDAQRKDRSRITKQVLDNEYIRDKMRAIAEYKIDAHHWNQEHFCREFIPIYQRAMDAYKQLSEKLEVSMHSEESHRAFLESVRDVAEPHLLDVDRFRDLTLRRSQRSAQHESVTQHQMENLSLSGMKAIFHLTNYLGGIYHLTADEVYMLSDTEVVIRECKNTSRHFLPSINDIKDGLFKLLLFSRLEQVAVQGKPMSASVELRLTSGRIREALKLPVAEISLREYMQRWHIPVRTRSLMTWLNEESRRIGIPVIIEGLSTRYE